MPRFLLILLALAGLAAAAWHCLPPQWSPWAPLDIQAPTTPVTWLKLRVLRANNSLCRAALATAPFAATSSPDPAPHTQCSLPNPVRVSGGPVRLSPSSFLASCPLAIDWAMTLVHGIQPAAQQAFGHPVTQIDHLGSYACRAIAGTDRASAHSTANALDVAAFQTQAGLRITIADWNDPGRNGAFLHAVRDAACRYFGLVLSPDYNAAHAGHFHLQSTGWGFCH